VYKGPVKVKRTEESYLATSKEIQWFGISDKYDREVSMRVRVNRDGSLNKMDLVSIKSKLGEPNPVTDAINQAYEIVTARS